MSILETPLKATNSNVEVSSLYGKSKPFQPLLRADLRLSQKGTPEYYELELQGHLRSNQGHHQSKKVDGFD